MTSSPSTLTVIQAAILSGLSSAQRCLPESFKGAWSETAINLRPAFELLPQPIQIYFSAITKQIKEDPQYTSVGLILTALVVAVAAMAGWGRNFWPAGGRFSPFGASASTSPPRVTNDDYSYITVDDLAQPQAAYNQTRPLHAPQRPSASDDIILLKIDGALRPIHFKPYSIDDGILSVGNLRHEAARIMGISDSRMVKLLYKGRILKDETRSCREEGLKIDSEVLCIEIENASGVARGGRGYNGEFERREGSESESEEAEGSGTGSKRNRNNRNRRKKNRNKKSPPGSGGMNSPHLAPPGANTSGSSRSSSPALPKSPMEKLGQISSDFQAKLLPQSIRFTQDPPSDPTMRDREHKYLTETILSSVLLKLDAVETEGDPDARQRRKDLVKETQGVLQGLDAVVKRNGP